jgi:hemerythrin-like domain-containing protein
VADRQADLPPARSPSHRRQQELLVGVHQHLREELDQIRAAVAQVSAGRSEAGTARASINAMAMRQNYWSIGAFCATYCRVVTTHHTIEDVAWFPTLAQGSAQMSETIASLHAEHEVISGLLVALDDALVALVADPSAVAAVALAAAGAAVESLSDALLAHLDREEGALLGPLGEVLVEG